MLAVITVVQKKEKKIILLSRDVPRTFVSNLCHVGNKMSTPEILRSNTTFTHDLFGAVVSNPAKISSFWHI